MIVLLFRFPSLSLSMNQSLCIWIKFFKKSIGQWKLWGLENLVLPKTAAQKKRESLWGSILRGGTKVSELIPGTVRMGQVNQFCGWVIIHRNSVSLHEVRILGGLSRQGKKKCQQVGLNRQDLGPWVALGKKSKIIYLGTGFPITWMEPQRRSSAYRGNGILLGGVATFCITDGTLSHCSEPSRS